MPHRDIITIGASAGGVEALKQVVCQLPADLPAAICIVLHTSPYGESALPAILRRAGKLPVTHAVDGAPLNLSHIYVAPPDHHLLVKRGHLRVVHGPAENGLRPAVDPLFRTAATSYGPRAIGVVLSGTLDDGTEGLERIKQAGGLAIVQDPHDALFSGMPQNAINHVAVDAVLPVQDIAAMLVQLVAEPLAEGEAAMTFDEPPHVLVELEGAATEALAKRGVAAGFTCPSCGGALWELHEGHHLRFQCRTGHAWSPESLLAARSESVGPAAPTSRAARRQRQSDLA